MGINKSPTIRRRHRVIAKGFVQLEFQLSTKDANIAASEAEVARLTKTRKRKAIPNPNKRFMLLGDFLANGESVVENEDAIAPLAVEEPVEEVENDDENDDDADDEAIPFMHYSRSRRAVKRPY
jgi:predicted oxidoreductase